MLGRNPGLRCDVLKMPDHGAFYKEAGGMDLKGILDVLELIYVSATKTTLGGQVDYWLERILGYRVNVEEIPGTELIRVSYRNRELGRDIRPKNVRQL